MKSNRPFVLLFLTIMFFLSCKQNNYVELDNQMKLVEPGFFLSELKIPDNLIFVDTRPLNNFNDGHIPNAINIWRDEMSDSLSMMLPRVELEKILGEKGIPSNSKIVAYDDHGSAEASRFWWVMYCNGFEDIHILNGGFEGWKHEGLPISNLLKKRAETDFVFPSNGDCTIAADFEYVFTHLSDSSITLVDTRTRDEFLGNVTKDGAKWSGHIPGSIHLDYYESIWKDSPSGKKVLPTEALQELFESHGIHPQDTIVTYCHSGARSAQTTFLLTQVLHYPHVKNYDGSWVEWSRKMGN